MKILVTGAKGFIGKNLIAELRNRKYNDILEFDRNTDISLLDTYTKKCDFVFHLAGVNRPNNENEFISENFKFTEELIKKLSENDKKPPILFTSSIQAKLDNQYGNSKKAAEKAIFGYKNVSKSLVYRLPNVFGKWCLPNYNSVVATFCYNISNGLDIKINDPNSVLNLVYIDDVVDEFINALENKVNRIGEYCAVPSVYTITLGKITELLISFKRSRQDLLIPNMGNDFEKKLYSTYLSYLPKEQFIYPLKNNSDNRGSFTEFIKTPDRGQVSINVSKPGITKGNHWHNTKNEKFLVVQGSALIKLRKIDDDEIINYRVTGKKLEVVDIPIGYTHCIINEGNTDLITVMWANEKFDPDKPDTYYLEV